MVYSTFHFFLNITFFILLLFISQIFSILSEINYIRRFNQILIMRFIFLMAIAVLIVLGSERFIALALKGQLSKPGTVKSVFKEMAKTLWLAMRLFVVIWIIYLIIMWWLGHKN